MKTTVFLFLFLLRTVTAVTIQDLGTLGGESSVAYAINNSGKITGSSQTAQGIRHSFLFEDGVMYDLFPFNCEWVQTPFPIGINDSGLMVSGSVSHGTWRVYMPATHRRSLTITLFPAFGVNVRGDRFNGVGTAINESGSYVGYAYLPAGVVHAFLRVPNPPEITEIDLGCPASSRVCICMAWDINDFGQIVGEVDGHPFIWETGTWTVLEEIQGSAVAINNSGQIAGRDGQHGFLYDHGARTDVMLSGAIETIPQDINSSGHIVGVAFVPPAKGSPEPHAFLFQFGQVIDLLEAIPNWRLAYAFGINNAGQIVGAGIINGHLHAYLLTP